MQQQQQGGITLAHVAAAGDMHHAQNAFLTNHPTAVLCQHILSVLYVLLHYFPCTQNLQGPSQGAA
jgi:hypothetical protein